VEAQRETLHMGEKIATQSEHESLADVAEESCVAIGERAGSDRDEQRRCTRRVQDGHRGGVERVYPGADQGHSGVVVG